jgi:hypothetical protein
MLATMGTSGEGVCEPEFCKVYGEAPYTCKPTTGFKRTECHLGDLAADQWCQRIAGKRAVAVSCSLSGEGETGETGDDTNGASWEPGTNVTYSTRNDRMATI